MAMIANVITLRVIRYNKKSSQVWVRTHHPTIMLKSMICLLIMWKLLPSIFPYAITMIRSWQRMVPSMITKLLRTAHPQEFTVAQPLLMNICIIISHKMLLDHCLQYQTIHPARKPLASLRHSLMLLLLMAYRTKWVLGCRLHFARLSLMPMQIRQLLVSLFTDATNVRNLTSFHTFWHYHNSSPIFSNLSSLLTLTVNVLPVQVFASFTDWDGQPLDGNLGWWLFKYCNICLA